jgi:hypothetical protein
VIDDSQLPHPRIDELDDLDSAGSELTPSRRQVINPEALQT